MTKENEIRRILVTFFRDGTKGDYLDALNIAVSQLTALTEANKITSNTVLVDSLPLDKCTRLEVINHKDKDKLGRAYVHWNDDNKIEGLLQDRGRTLKLFITKR